jgi:hypothetical protein
VVNIYATWKKAVDSIKLVVDVVDKIAEVHPYAKMAWSVLSMIPKTILNQVERDENVQTLLQGIHDVFDLAEVADRLRTIKPGSKQAEIFTAMLKHVCNCGDFIQSYAKDTQFWKRIFKNIGGERDMKIEDYRTTLFHLQDLFLNHATVTTEITALQILDDVGGLSTRLGIQITAVSNQIVDASLNATIREIPYAQGSRFSTEKCCLPRTRTAFLDCIVDWVNNPDSERALILFGQAGTGKSAIAHEVARRFDNMHRLSSSFINRRAEGSKPYLLFTTLARDLADRYPSFKAALGRAIQDDTSRRIGARDYSTLFESLLQRPLRNLHLVGPILVVIDALDESGDASGSSGLHSFLADHISELPSNF